MAETTSSGNHYELLGIGRSATDQEIKAAYRREASRWHPDHEGGDAARFAAITEARDTLLDPGKRRDYDKKLSDGLHAEPSGPYLVPDRIDWTWDGGADPEPVTIGLYTSGDDLVVFGPDDAGWMGDFWAITDATPIMSGEHLADYVVAAQIPASVGNGLREDAAVFLVDDHSVTLPITLEVRARAGHRTEPPRGSPRRDPHASGAATAGRRSPLGDRPTGRGDSPRAGSTPPGSPGGAPRTTAAAASSSASPWSLLFTALIVIGAITIALILILGQKSAGEAAAEQARATAGEPMGN